MYILKKLNREKKVGTAAEVAVLQEKGWKLIQEKKPFEKAELDEVEPDAGAEPEKEVEPDAEAEPEKKTSARSRKKE